MSVGEGTGEDLHTVAEPSPAPKLTKSEAKIADHVAGALRADLGEFRETLRVDVLNDMKEIIAKTVVPQVGQGPAPPAPPLNVPPGVPPVVPQQGPPPDFGKMNDAQLKAYKDNQFIELVKVFGPVLLQQQQQNPLIQEMLNRILMDQVAGGVNLQRALMSRMLGDVGGMQSALASQQAIHQQTTAPIFAAAGQAFQGQAAMAGGPPIGP